MFNALDGEQDYRVHRRLFICCDGTWEDGLNHQRPITNLARFARCINETSIDRAIQIVYYDNGVGNVNSWTAPVIDALTGRGISAKIRNAYSFLSHNYTFDRGQTEIFLFGYSRGAFTVQCLAWLINDIGLLKPQHLRYLRVLFDLWAEQRLKSDSGSQFSKVLAQLLRSSTGIASRGAGQGGWEFDFNEDVVIGAGVDVADKDISSLILEDLGAAKRVKIKVCAVWDTVSTLGLPILRTGPRPLSFVGNDIPDVVDNAFQALSLNESRKGFKPRVWKAGPVPRGKAVKQCWFLGTHGDIGGGTKDIGLAVLSMAWMIAQLKEKAEYVSLDDDILMEILDKAYWEWERPLRKKLSLPPDLTSTEGRISKTSALWGILGSRKRDINEYLQTSSKGKLKNDEDENLDPNHIGMNIHWTVRILMANTTNHKCRTLSNWTAQRWNVDEKRIVWSLPTKKGQSSKQQGLLEDIITQEEERLLKRWANRQVSFNDGSSSMGIASWIKKTKESLRIQFFAMLDKDKTTSQGRSENLSSSTQTLGSILRPLLTAQEWEEKILAIKYPIEGSDPAPSMSGALS